MQCLVYRYVDLYMDVGVPNFTISLSYRNTQGSKLQIRRRNSDNLIIFQYCFIQIRDSVNSFATGESLILFNSILLLPHVSNGIAQNR